MATKADFWGEIAAPEIRTPVSILREQASLLGTKTQNLVEASVETDVHGDGEFVHTFRLVVPALDNYAYKLFQVSHSVSLYPVRVFPEKHTLDTEQDFIAWLRQTLSSNATKKLIGNLIAQVRS